MKSCMERMYEPPISTAQYRIRWRRDFTVNYAKTGNKCDQVDSPPFFFSFIGLKYEDDAVVNP